MTGRRIWLALIGGLLVLAGLALLLVRPEPGAEAPGPETARQRQSPASGGGALPQRDAGQAQPAPPDLASILALSPRCELGPALWAIFDRLVEIDAQTSEASRGGPVTVPGFGAAILPTFERRIEPLEPGGHLRHVIAGLDLAGRWHGLRVTGLRFDFYEQSDVTSRQIRFAEAPERVREVLAGQGFELPPVGALREIEGEGMQPSIGVEPSPEGAVLTCTTG